MKRKTALKKIIKEHVYTGHMHLYKDMYYGYALFFRLISHKLFKINK